MGLDSCVQLGLVVFWGSGKEDSCVNMVKIRVSKWVQAPQTTDPDRVSRDRKLDTVFKGSCYPPHCPQVRLDAKIHGLEKRYLGPQDASVLFLPLQP